MSKITYADFKNLSDVNCFIYTKGALVAKYLKDKIFIKDQVMYIINPNLTVEPIPDKNQENYILNIVSRLIQNSFNDLREEQQELLQKNKGFVSLCKNSGIKSFLPQLLCSLQEEYDLNTNKHEIHFNNGFIDVRTLEFKQRERPNYVTSCIPRDYVKSTENSREFINNLINKIYPIEEDRKTVLMILGSAFSGSVVNDRTSLFLLGKSSAGKSVIMKLLRIAFSSTYVEEFASDTFEKNNKNANKIFNEFQRKPNIRISWVNELSSSRTDISLFKKFCEGVLQTVSLYKDGFNTIKHDSKVICTSNEMPNLQIDTGTESRILAYNHISKFVDNINEVDETKHYYLGDKKLIDKITNNTNYKNAIIDIILEYTSLYVKNNKIKLSQSFKDAKDEIVNANDYIQDFIDSELIITENETDRIGKDRMLTLYQARYPGKRMNIQNIISALKDKNLKYSGQHRINKVRGCFLFVKEKEHGQEEFEAINYFGVSNKEHKKVLDENKELKEQIEELQRLLQEQKDLLSAKSKNEVKKITTKKTKNVKNDNKKDDNKKDDNDNIINDFLILG